MGRPAAVAGDKALGQAQLHSDNRLRSKISMNFVSAHCKHMLGPNGPGLCGQLGVPSGCGVVEASDLVGLAAVQSSATGAAAAEGSDPNDRKFKNLLLGDSIASPHTSLLFLLVKNRKTREDDKATAARIPSLCAPVRLLCILHECDA